MLLRYTGINKLQAFQQTLLFSSSAHAASEYQLAVTAMEGCQQLSRSIETQQQVAVNAIVSRISATASGSAWTRVWNGANTYSSQAGPQVNVEYFAQSGRALTFVDFTVPGLTAPPVSSAAAAAVLDAMTTGLRGYGP
jgi:hypothetical protein